MKKILLLSLWLVANLAWGQTTDATQTTSINATIRNIVAPAGITKGAVSDRFQDLVNSKVNRAEVITASGTDNYSVTGNSSLTYSQNFQVMVKFTNGNTGSSTLNINGLGAKTIKKNVSTNLSSGDIIAGQILHLNYDGTNFQVIGSIGSSGGGGHVIENAGTPLTNRANLNVTNGLTAADNTPDTDVKLGGELTESTYISPDVNNTRALWVGINAAETKAVNDLTLAAATTLQATHTGTGGYLLLNGSGLDINSGSGALKVTDSRGTPRGFQYDADYSATYTARSLIDKGFADAAYAPIAGGSFWSLASGGTLTGANTIAHAGFNVLFTGTGKTTFSNSATLAGLNVGANASNPSVPTNGDLFYNSTTGFLGIRSNAQWAFVGSGSGTSSFVLGETVTAPAVNAIAIGYNTTANGNNTVSFGANAGSSSGTLGVGAISIGKDANYSKASVGGDGIAIGEFTHSGGTNSIAIGAVATATGEQGIAIGYRAGDQATHADNAISFGYHANWGGFGALTIGAESTAIGNNVAATGVGSIAIGRGTTGASLMINSTANSFGLGWATTSPSILLSASTASFLNSSSGLVVGSNSLTALTRLDVRGISSGNALRLADDSNTPIMTVLNTGDVSVTGLSTSTTDVTVAQAIHTAGSPAVLSMVGAAHTTLAASTEATDISFNLARTVQFSTGALTNQRAFRVRPPDYAFVGSSTLSFAAGMEIQYPPRANTNAIITETAGLYIGTADVSNGGTVGTSYGLIVNASTGATNNYAATFGDGSTIFSTPTTAYSSIRLPHGTAPSSPVDGDFWTTSAGVFVRVNGVTVGPLGAGGGGMTYAQTLAVVILN